MTAINSHAILPIARECARLDGDLWLIYMGNNEMVGPFGAATVFGAKAPPGWLVRVRLALGQTRLVQGLEDLSRRWRGHRGGRTWEGMKLFLENKLAPDHPSREAVYRNFRANLEDILRAGEHAGVPIVLSTVAVNLKDFAPLASLPGRAAGSNLPPDFAKLAAAAAAAQAARDWPDAIRAYETAAGLVPRHAEIQFRLGQCQLAVSNHVAALAHFSQARDDDALPFRADSRVNAIIEEAGRAHADRGVRLLDAVATMAAHSSVGIPGAESFYEHVHFNFEGNYRLARALAESVASQLPINITNGAPSEWATRQQCEHDLGLTDWNRSEVFDNVARRLAQAPFTGQLGNDARIRLWRARVNELKQQLTATNAVFAREVYLEALQRSPADFRLHWNFAEFLEATRDLPRATEEWRQVKSLIPHHHVAYFQIGRLLAEQVQREEARKWLHQAVALRPDLAAGWLELGALGLAEGRSEEALQHFSRARDLAPENAHIQLQRAKALSKLKRSDEAIEQARAALKLDTNSWAARSFLGEELAFAGRVAEAQREFEAVLRVNPNYPWAHLNLGVALLKQGHREKAIDHFEEALRLDPKLLRARQYLEQLKSQPPSNP
jgi:tetratricopeptide (TPR) repeat protein